jgi:hypothetical protein
MPFIKDPEMPKIRPWWLNFLVYWRLIFMGGKWVDPRDGQEWMIWY